jgi:hypothetical protein
METKKRIETSNEWQLGLKTMFHIAELEKLGEVCNPSRSWRDFFGVKLVHQDDDVTTDALIDSGYHVGFIEGLVDGLGANREALFQKIQEAMEMPGVSTAGSQRESVPEQSQSRARQAAPKILQS